VAAKTPVLYHIEISHYNEKARWALDYKHVPHIRRAPAPMLHMAVAAWLTRGKPTFPVLKLNGDAIGDSTRIIETLEREYPEPALYPQGADDRRRALELEDFFDEELGPYIRRFLFHLALEEIPPGEFIDGALGSSPRAVKAAMRATAPVGRRMLKLRYGINPDDAQAAGHKTEAALDRVAAELQPSGYLVGDGFSVADLTAAALLFPLVRPPEAPYMLPAPLPPSFARFRDSLSDHRAFDWVREMYHRHRGHSAEVKA
jgi:glutathione S-transferase